MEEVMSSFVSSVMGEPATLMFSSVTVWLLAMASGYVIVNRQEFIETDWQGMARLLPPETTYDPGECDRIGGLEVTFIPRSNACQLYAVS